MDQKGFYIELISNVVTELFPHNQIGNFVTPLFKRIELEGEWEVALVEIAYHKSWPNVRQENVIHLINSVIELSPQKRNKRAAMVDPLEMEIENLSKNSDETRQQIREELKQISESNDKENKTFEKTNDPKQTTQINKEPKNVNFETVKNGIIRAGYYFSVKNLINQINRQLKVFEEVETYPYLEYDSHSDLVEINGGKLKQKYIIKNLSPYVYPLLGNEIEHLLGLKDQKNRGVLEYCSDPELVNSTEYTKLQKGKFKGFYSPDIEAGIYSLYVYCDIVYPQLVGDSSVKLLHCVEIPNRTKYKEQVVIKYAYPNYVPLITNSFQTIEINIKDDSNETIPFRTGRVRLKLHFRPKE